MGLGRCVVTHIICTRIQKKFHALWSLKLTNYNLHLSKTEREKENIACL